MLSVLNYLISEELFPSVKEFVCPCLQIKCLKLPWDKADLFKNLKTQTIPLNICGSASDLSDCTVGCERLWWSQVCLT